MIRTKRGTVRAWEKSVLVCARFTLCQIDVADERLS